LGRPPVSRGRISLRDQMLRNQATMDLYAAMADKPRVIINMPPAPKPRAAPEPSGVPLEKDVQKQIIDGLRMHRMIALVERVNSGTSVERNAAGEQRHIPFHRVYRVDGRRMNSPDIHCTLVGGKRFVIEVKRPGWRGPRGEREEGQLAYIQHLRSVGAFGMFATGWDEVEIELRRIEPHLRSSPSK